MDTPYHEFDDSFVDELDFQELEALDAPGWYSGFKDGVIITAATVAVAAAT